MENDFLKDLREVHWPEPVSFWPPAFGYYVVLGILVVFALITWYFWGFGRIKRRLKKQLLKELEAIEENFHNHRDKNRLQASLSALIRRLAFFAGPAHLSRAASLDEISTVLLKIFPEKEKTLHLVELLKKERFHKDPTIDGEELLFIARTQITKCRI